MQHAVASQRIYLEFTARWLDQLNLQTLRFM